MANHENKEKSVNDDLVRHQDRLDPQVLHFENKVANLDVYVQCNLKKYKYKYNKDKFNFKKKYW